MTVHVFGVRHHGPGSARAVRAALEELAPDLVLVEGPPDAQAVLPLLGHGEMKPPVALLVYASDAPSRAVFYPFAVFSPEWQALSYAVARGTPARFIDLPMAHQLPGAKEEPEKAEHEGEAEETAEPETPEASAEAAIEDDPLGALAEAAGYTDRELWWEHQIEQRRDVRGVFEAILDAMGALRAGRPVRGAREGQREAFMRRSIRAAEKEGFARIAVVCGAWHAPALVGGVTAKSDDALLKGLPKTKVEATWIPWTYSRLSYRSGYGAGIASPGWYAHLWESPDRAPLRWVSRVARLLREADLDASSASVIETVRLADALAALRGLSMPGLSELGDAVQSVLCHGDAAPIAVIRSKLEIGDQLGEVPDETPAVPLQRDLSSWQKRLRLKPSTEIRILELDLRTENDRLRSSLFHRLALLGVPWATPEKVTGQKAGTFHERWSIVWRPELAVSLIEASIFGSTIEAASGAKVVKDAAEAELGILTSLLDAAILAELPSAVDHVLARVQEKAAVSGDVRALMEGLVPLARTARYGSVRETRAEPILKIIGGLFERIVVGLVGACASLDDDAAQAMLTSIARVHESLALLERAEEKEEWTGLLRALVARDAIHGLVRGGACRLLVEQRTLEPAELERLARLALSPANPPAQAAAWAEGLLRGSALLLLHHDGVWLALDEWIASLPDEAFVEMLPLVRRAFAEFGPAERRQMAEKVKKLRAGGGVARAAEPVRADLDPERAARVYPVLSTILGVEVP
ncbi:MAG TPA: DUF5682 family protein [Polyangiaceae bacterium]|jgi:hypothetical protein